MSVTIFRDTEEALSRAVRRITTFYQSTASKTILKETYDPISGDIVTRPMYPSFYDSSADASSGEYPQFFIRLMKSREDRATGRVLPEYGKWFTEPVANAPKAYEQILTGAATIMAAGNLLLTDTFQIRKIQPGFLLRLIQGNNVGTYTVATVTPQNTGGHQITVSNTIVSSMPSLYFNSITREVLFSLGVDLSTCLVGDNFIDSGSNTFMITAINVTTGSLTINGSNAPVLTAGANITRTGNVFQNTDTSDVLYIVMDPTKPIMVTDAVGNVSQLTTSTEGLSPSIPLDVYYLVRIDSKTRENHRDILNRVWEEFNPPRTALPVIIRTATSAESILSQDVTSGGSNTINVVSNANFNIGDPVYIFDNLTPTSRPDGLGYQRPFQSVVTNIISTNQIVVQDVVPDSFLAANVTKVVSNANFGLYMFHFVDHVTKDVEGSQYWSHEFTFWVQIWVDRLETPGISTVITDIDGSIVDMNDNQILSE